MINGSIINSDLYFEVGDWQTTIGLTPTIFSGTQR